MDEVMRRNEFYLPPQISCSLYNALKWGVITNGGRINALFSLLPLSPRSDGLNFAVIVLSIAIDVGRDHLIPR